MELVWKFYVACTDVTFVIGRKFGSKYKLIIFVGFK